MPTDILVLFIYSWNMLDKKKDLIFSSPELKVSSGTQYFSLKKVVEKRLRLKQEVCKFLN